MRMFDFLKPKAPEQKFEARPVEVNAPLNVRAARAAGRLSRLMSVREMTDEVRGEIRRHQAALVAAGYDEPADAAQAAALATKLGGE